MEIRTLKSFIAVATLKNFSAAAREMNTVQPAISRHISELEEELGVSLFWRNTREVKITAAGKSLLKNAKEIISKETEAIEQTKRASKGEIGILKIGYIPSASFTFLPGLIRNYSKLYPDVKISLNEMSVQKQIDQFERGELDIGISRPLPDNIKKYFSFKNLYMDYLISVLPNSHSLAGKKSLHLNELSQDNFILFNRNEASGLFDRIINECFLEKFTPNIYSQPLSMQTVLTEVASGLGVTIVPGCIKKLYSNGCVFIPIKNQKASIATELHYKTDQLNPTVEAFVNLTMQSLEMIKNNS